MMDDDGFVDMGSSSLINNNSTGWLMDYMNEEVQDTTAFIWSSQVLNDPTLQRGCPGELLDISTERNETNLDNSPRGEPSSGESGLKTKACREKIRRDKLNDRFLELCSILEPGRPPTTDKLIVLTDATRALKQLCLETKRLKESNEAIQDRIKSLKAEKSDLREEKVRLKAEKEKMEKTLKGMAMPSPPLLSHPAAFHAPVPFSTTGKTVPYQINYPLPPIAMWQWMAPACLDTSQDHVLRPPVA
ncbi:hypothetical protein MKW94_013336 [Papaver nudicaule]|uniref:BHLH domain-containing protein n=1 Tax=Papaver nudicaule TaxID=74823 RepID=A0AA42B0X8_PAPNU|nr:hypothetical protein [Papaver nudicaule]